MGKALTLSMDCKACHKEEEASIGPMYIAIANKYKDDTKAMTYLQKKIVAGGTGVWGEVMMPAHPNITSEESRQITMYIQSLVNDKNKKPTLPPKGSIIAEANEPDNVLVITASYTDNGAEGTIPLTGMKSVALTSNTVLFSEATKTEGMQVVKIDGKELLLLAETKGWFQLNDIDLTGVKSISLNAGWRELPKISYDFEARLNAPDGEVVAKGTMSKPRNRQSNAKITLPLVAEISKQSTLYIIYAVEAGKEPAQVALMNATFN